MNYILFDDSTTRSNLFPLTFTRPIAELRVGMTTLREKWESALGSSTSTLTDAYLEEKFPLRRKSINILINASVFPEAALVDRVKKLKQNQALSSGDVILAYRMTDADMENIGDQEMDELEFEGDVVKLNNLWDIYVLNDRFIVQDFERLTSGRTSQPISQSNTVIGDPKRIFIEEGAEVEGATLNTKEGPIYIGKEAQVMEGASIRGSFAMMEHAVIKMGARIYGATTLGPYAKVGGEVQNVVFIGYSNKPHDGYLGNSVIGEWCNIGAGTTSSNLKNTYDEVKLWSYTWSTFERTGQQFCGLIMGDYTKVAIQTLFNTGTVVGVGATVFGSGFQRNFIPSFTWGGKMHDVKKVIEVAKRMYQRRDLVFSPVEAEILENVFEMTHNYRKEKA